MYVCMYVCMYMNADLVPRRMGILGTLVFKSGSKAAPTNGIASSVKGLDFFWKVYHATGHAEALAREDMTSVESEPKLSESDSGVGGGRRQRWRWWRSQSGAHSGRGPTAASDDRLAPMVMVVLRVEVRDWGDSSSVT
jgi:hypothetical protein